MDEASRAFVEQLPRKRTSAGALITDADGRVLIVEPTYKPNWEVPGGIVEAGESTATACIRECEEELGYPHPIGRLLLMDQRTDPPPRGDSIAFIYDGGVIDDPGRITISVEHHQFQFVPAEDLERYTNPRLAQRIRCGLQARASGRLMELEDGAPRDARLGHGRSR